MKKTLRLLKLFWASSIAAELEYRVNFLFSLLSSGGGLAGSVFGVSLFYRGSARLGGWPFEQALLVLGWFTVLTGLSRMLLEPNLSKIVEHVQKGTLDFVLLKPVDTQFWLSTRRLSPWGATDVVFGAGLIVYGGSRAGVLPGSLLLALLPLAASVVILYSLWFLLATTTVWFVKIYNVTEVLIALLDAGKFPITAFPEGAYRFVFTFLLPVAFLTTVPAEVLLARGSPAVLALGVFVACVLLGASRVFFRYALRYYTSASS